MPGASHSIGEEIRGVLAFVGLIWVAFLVELIVPADLAQVFGLAPRTLHGLIGIPAMPFLHDGWGHIMSNTVPLLVLLVLLAGSRAHTWEIVGAIMLLGGGLLWIFGATGKIHAGASGLVFGLIAFLIVSGILERRIIPMFISAVVAFFYGGTLFYGVLPSVGERISWEGHLYGAIAGVVVAYGLTREPKQGNNAGEPAA